MQPIIEHNWDLLPEQAMALQQQFAQQLITQDDFTEIGTVAGVDVAYAKESDQVVAAVVVLDVQTQTVIETVTAEAQAHFPYLPGLFSFRELPALIQAFAKLRQPVDLVVCDGQGMAHPRRCGLASHLGLLFDVPSIGCGKTRLIGEHQEVAAERGASAPLYEGSEVVGQVLRTQTGIKPVYVSIGHRISLATACDWVVKLSPQYRLPETTRQADHAVKMRLKQCQPPTV